MKLRKDAITDEYVRTKMQGLVDGFNFQKNEREFIEEIKESEEGNNLERKNKTPR